ncbi:NACHT LRR and PYD domains-containing protein 6 [Dissostichus eleginoides]|uniref:NACHT LRR and PYD domains-containing protein 6 n=1 Tax=Dissostichus eleginoides TaxID=100907 RepID=A0AAD9B251_DISEL|nr:NACHT LRR and PYD domains-containing protein 6 [Dissostichus eleginoides]
METPREVLLGTLESLGKKELKKFKWCLEEEVLGFPGIPKSRLEKADQMDTVDLMLLEYDINTIKVTREVLKMIPRNDLEEKLSETSSDPKAIYQVFRLLIYPSENHHLHMVSGLRWFVVCQSSVDPNLQFLLISSLLLPGDDERGERREETECRRKEGGNRVQEKGGRKQRAGERREETECRRKEGGNRVQEKGGRKQSAGERREETESRRKEGGNRVQEKGGRKQSAGERREETESRRKEGGNRCRRKEGGNRGRRKEEETECRKKEGGNRVQEKGGRKQRAGERREETECRRKEGGNRVQEKGGRKQRAGERREETESRRKEGGNREQEKGGRKQSAGEREMFLLLAFDRKML